MTSGVLDGACGFGSWGNPTEVIIMESLNHEEKKAYAKELWLKDPKAYYEWKAWCIRLDQLPDFFGTSDNPIPIDESKL
ncbi:hypothetical protein [uncultured Methanobrevibacter sp.]|uniref:hypothetical protein n=1 Tax=uncultured Methanobrevibacter sp. TaxID=253161 RepID=UPI0026E0394C|nr:hypothetical protein [uncultured Methanobrevibacter sp.]